MTDHDDCLVKRGVWNFLNEIVPFSIDSKRLFLFWLYLKHLSKNLCCLLCSFCWGVEDFLRSNSFCFQLLTHLFLNKASFRANGTDRIVHEYSKVSLCVSYQDKMCCHEKSLLYRRAVLVARRI